MKNYIIFTCFTLMSFSSCYSQNGLKKDIDISLLQGKWILATDSTISIIFQESTFKQCLENKELYSTRFNISDSCLNNIPKTNSKFGNKIIYKEEDGSIVCVTIEYINQGSLALFYENIGNKQDDYTNIKQHAAYLRVRSTR